MVGSRGDDGVWADDAIPVPEPPALGDIGASTRPVSPSPVPDDPVFEPLRDSEPSPDAGHQGSRRTRRIAGVGIAGIAVATVAVVMSASHRADPSDAALPTSTSDVEVSTTQRTVAPPTTTSPDPAEPVSLPPPTLLDDLVELPPTVAAIGAPTELLLLAEDGLLHTLSLPSGRLRSTVLAATDDRLEGWEGVEIVVSPDAAAIAIWPDVAIVPRDGHTSTIVEGSQLSPDGIGIVGWRRRGDGQVQFEAVAYPAGSDPQGFTIDLDGSVSEIDPASIPEIGADAFVAPNGDTFVNDAGGIYQVAPDRSSHRIDQGRLSGLSATHLLVRACSEDRTCGLVVVDRATGERREVPTGAVPDRLLGDRLDLSPDGSAVSWVLDGPDGAVERSVVDLTTGARTSAPTTWSWAPSGHWAADSSGVFDVSGEGTGVDFLDRASGAVAHFADELGRIVGLAIRMPESELGPQESTFTIPISFGDVEPSVQGLEVTAMTRSGTVVEVDLDDGAATMWSTPPQVVRGAPWLFRLGAEVAVLTGRSVDDDRWAGYVAAPGVRRPLPADLLGRGPALPGPTPGTVWTAAADTTDGVELVLVDLARGVQAEPPVSISVPRGIVLGGDGRGGVVVELGGDTYVATADSLQRLTTGELLAIGADTAYVRECDDTPTCRVVRVDRLSGERVPLPSQPGLDQALAIDSSDPALRLMGSAVAPGGDVAVLRAELPSSSDARADRDPVWLLLDVVSGESSVLEGFDGGAPMVWSGDSSSAVTLIGPDLVVVERASGRTTTVNGLDAIGVLAGADVTPLG